MSNDWQPIKTAPKDGKPVLIYQPEEAIRNYNTGFSVNLPPVVYVCMWESGISSWVEAEGEQYSSFDPTHWMPLPKPPTNE